jgi:hypothetical protein
MHDELSSPQLNESRGGVWPNVSQFSDVKCDVVALRFDSFDGCRFGSGFSRTQTKEDGICQKVPSDSMFPI